MRIESVPIGDLRDAIYNPRKDLKPGHPEYERLKKSLIEFDYIDPVVWNKRTGNVVGGHQRLKILRELGYEKIYVSVVDLDDTQEKALNLALNKTGGDWDLPKLKDLLEELDTGAFDMEITGFGEDEIANLMSQFRGDDKVVEDDFDAGKEAAAISDPTSRTGDIWRLGNHRVCCGDSTISDDVKRLMDGHLADMVFTDPPYNVDYVGKTKESLKIQNDKMNDDEFYSFLLETYVRMLESTKPGGAIYVCHADSEGANFRRAMQESGWFLKQCIIWVKDVLVMGRQDHHWKHEPILYGWKPGAKHRWFGGRKQTTVFESGAYGLAVDEQSDGVTMTFSTGKQNIVVRVPSYEVVYGGADNETTIWRVPKPLRNGDHPTMKPILLCAKAIQNSSREGDIVLDLFGGSGSTLMACEQTQRLCYTMELDPVYCDVIIKRWETFTGKKAVRTNGSGHGETHEVDEGVAGKSH